MKRIGLIATGLAAGIIILAFTGCEPLDIMSKYNPEIKEEEASNPIVEYERDETLAEKVVVEVYDEGETVVEEIMVDEKEAVAAMVGVWVLENEEDNRFVSIGKMTVSDDGTYKYVDDAGVDSHEGKISLEVEEYIDFDVQYISFTDDNGEHWVSCYIPAEDPDVYYIGNGGVSRFTRVK